MRLLLYATAAVVGLSIPAQCAEEREEPPESYIAEGMPTRLDARAELTENRFRLVLLTGPQSERGPFNYIFEEGRFWTKAWSGKPITVAFNGGDNALHTKIADAAQSWAQLPGVKLKFEFRDKKGNFRTWSKADKTYTSDVRISFNHPEGGRWSVIGTESIDSTVAGPGEPSMNLQGFVSNPPPDRNLIAIVRHEVGHALGFHHEHQSPRGGCDNEFRWEDDADGTPGIYTVLGRKPNEWSKAKVDHNLRHLPNSNAYTPGPYDNKSIMHYSFPAWMFKRARNSPCYTGTNYEFSQGDRDGARKAYPSDKSALQAKIVANKEKLQIIMTYNQLELQDKKHFATIMDTLPPS